jgi:acyl-CoA thioesterase-1
LVLSIFAFPILALLLSSNAAALILLVGDSIGAGYGVPQQRSWTKLLEQKISPHRIINASISGDTSSGAKARLPDLLKHYQPDIVIIEIGGNDGLRGQPVSLLEKNLRAMVELSRNAGANVLLLGMHIPPNYGDIYTTAFHQTFHRVSKSMAVPLVPFLLEGIALKPELMQADRVHPNTNAQPLIVQNVLPVLAPMLN